MALTKAKNYSSRGSTRFTFPMASGETIHKGAIVVLDGGLAKAAITALSLVAIGIAENGVKNDGANGDTRVNIRKDELYPFANEVSDPITLADVGSDCFIVDDETVAKTDGTGTRSVAGIIRDVDADGVWVQFK